MIQISRKKLPQIIRGRECVIFAGNSYERSDKLRYLLIEAWCECKFISDKGYVFKNFYAFEDDHDWTLFKIANGIMGDMVEIVDKDIDGYWQ